MPVHNADIANMFEKVADLLEIQGENPFRVRAYRQGARTVAGHSRELAEMIAAGEDPQVLPGIGEDLAEKIRELVETGTLAQLPGLEQETAPALRELLHLPGLGPERVRRLHEELGIESIQDLEAAASAGRISALPGFGAKTEARILSGIAHHREAGKRMGIASAGKIAMALQDFLSGLDGVEHVEVAGSLRRRRETVGDLDIVVASRHGAAVLKQFVAHEDVAEIVSQGSTRASMVLRSGLDVDVRVVPKESFGAALLYFTGSQPHHVALRGMSQDRGLKINEYGVHRGDERIAGRTEQEMYAALDLPYIEPELRENRGEFEAARTGTLPDLVSIDDIRGDLHMHTTATDGHNSLREMAEAARKRGYAYIAITDHSHRLRMTNGLDEKRLRTQMAEIDALNEDLEGITILKGIEVDILEDGTLDFADEVLRDLDIVLCSVHSHFGLSRTRQTERLVRAMNHPSTTIVGHPTGRLMGGRQPIELDMERVMDVAKDTGCVLEVNANPHRLDLSDVHCRMAKERGVTIAVSTDAHDTGGLDDMRFGIGQARRGWLEKADVVNTRSLGELRKALKRQ
jgi:DNA polymerase (family 10)